MGFKLSVPNVRLRIGPDQVSGGLAAWGEGELDVTVRGDVSLERYLSLVEVVGGAGPEDEDSPERLQKMRTALAEFGDAIVSWNIEGIDASGEAYGKLPYPLAIAMFAAWTRAGDVSPNSPAVSANGTNAEAGSEQTEPA